MSVEKARRFMVPPRVPHYFHHLSRRLCLRHLDHRLLGFRVLRPHRGCLVRHRLPDYHGRPE